MPASAIARYSATVKRCRTGSLTAAAVTKPAPPGDSTASRPPDTCRAERTTGFRLVSRLGLEGVERPPPVPVLEEREVGRRDAGRVHQHDFGRDRLVGRPRRLDALSDD